MGTKRSRQDSVSSSEAPSTPYSRAQSVDVKIVHLDAASAVSHQPAIMQCSLPPHQPLSFDSFEAYDVHYQKTHVNRCSECHNNFPDEHFLHLHIAENHDPISDAKRDQGERTYACLVPDCDRLCSTPQKRRLHCIDKHQFPRNYDFFIVNDGIDRRSSMLRPPHRRRSSAIGSKGENSSGTRRRGDSSASTPGDGMDVVKAEDHGEVEEQDAEPRRMPLKLRGRGGFSRPRTSGRAGGRGGAEVVSPSENTTAADPVDSLASSMSALHFVPHSVRMARGRGRGRVDK